MQVDFPLCQSIFITGSGESVELVERRLRRRFRQECHMQFHDIDAPLFRNGLPAITFAISDALRMTMVTGNRVLASIVALSRCASCEALRREENTMLPLW